ncbi:hypothetical protein P692DRAFT_20837688 [Suillus brevipes Sb2]|nr:hypothetical protein P692DRAFT_20837688 [Suillus brevipes Sb2]
MALHAIFQLTLYALFHLACPRAAGCLYAYPLAVAGQCHELMKCTSEKHSSSTISGAKWVPASLQRILWLPNRDDLIVKPLPESSSYPSEMSLLTRYGNPIRIRYC